MTETSTKEARITPSCVEALQNYEQADYEGIMVLASRQAIHETIDAYWARVDACNALAAERDKWHAGWMEAEAKVSELEAERDALQRRLELYEGTQGDPVSASGLVEDLSSALEQYSIKCNALAEENAALKAELHEARMQSLVDFGKLQKTCEERDALKTEVERLREALTPSGDTKAAYMGEIECACPAVTWRHDVPWVSIKAIMAMIRDRAALQENTDD